MNERLKQCPCCEGDAVMERHSHREFQPSFSVQCKECRLGTTTYKSETLAATAWNRRPKPTIIHCGDCYHMDRGVCCCTDSPWCANCPKEDDSCVFGKAKEVEDYDGYGGYR